MRFVATPSALKSHPAVDDLGALILEVYGPNPTDFLNYLRSICVSNEAGRWKFHQAGVPFSFEDTSRYESRRVRDRLTPELLAHYAAELGVRPFDEGFFKPAGSILVERSGPVAPLLQEFNLDGTERN